VNIFSSDASAAKVNIVFQLC